MPSYPILTYPEFFSATIKDYLREISAQVGLYIGFGRGSKPGAKAFILTYPDLPAAAIIIDIDEINASVYDSQQHDPLIAHEATHLQLYHEGWLKLEFPENLDQESRDKITAIENWLSDPIVNQRIAVRGFSMGPDRRKEIEESIAILRRRGWSQIINKGLGDELFIIRLFVSYMLEPQVPTALKTTFREVFRQDLPEVFEFADGLLDLIRAHGYETPAKYRETAILCLQEWNVDTQKIGFGSPGNYPVEEQLAWVAKNATPEINWDGTSV